MTASADRADFWPSTSLLEIARIVVPFWLYVTVANIAIFALLSGGLEGGDLLARALQHALLLPLLVLCYRAALAIGWPAAGRWRAALLHLLLGVGFASVTRFVLWATQSLALWDPSWMTSERMDLIPELRAIGVNVLLFFLPYWAGLALLFGILSYRRLRDVTLRAAHLESEYVKAKLQVLHGQLNPHFLFNTLHSVHGLIDEHPATARNMLVRLGDLLRRSLQQGEPGNGHGGRIELRDEIELTRAYLEIQQLRFSDRLDYRIEVDALLSAALVPVFLLQPLAENAIVHGMTALGEQVAVRIAARQLGELLELEVVNTATRPAHAVREFRIGLGNTTERLRTLYGERASISFERPEGNGFIVRVRLPLEMAPTAEAA